MEKNNELVQLIAEACDDKLAKNIVVLNMDEISLIADYFLICHGNNERQVQAIARSIRDVLTEQGIDVERMEGSEKGRWIVIDTGDIVCHVFHENERTYYNLERLWGDASRVPLRIGQEK